MGTLFIEGFRVHYEHRRPEREGRGKRLIYIHGTGCDTRVFERHMAAVAVEHEVVAIDLPGHGKSEGSGFRGVADYAYVTAGLIEHLDWDTCIAAGHSLGGGIALALATYFPANIEGLVLIDTGARLRVGPVILETARRTASGEPAPPVNSRLGFSRDTAQEIVDSVQTLTADCDPRVIYKDWVADDSFDFMSRLAQIAVPTLAICGADDPLTPLKYHEYFRDHMPDCRLEVIPGAGHWPFVEQPQAFDRRVLDFLDELCSG